MTPTRPPIIFISYSHDTPEHVERVLALANRLRQDGIDCRLDQYAPAPPEGWPRWMERQLREADYVLVVCTEDYLRRAEGRETPGSGRGARWESTLLYQHLYDADSYNARFIPVLFSRDDEPHIPVPLRGATWYCLERESGYEGLYRRLTEQPATLPPELGERRALPPRPAPALTFPSGGQIPAETAPFYVPFRRNPDFVGREPDLERLHQVLTGANTEASTPVGIRPPDFGLAGVTGMGGIGKTQLAVDYAYRYRDAYPGGVFWVNAIEPLAQGLAGIGVLLRPALVEGSLEQQIHGAAAHLREHPDALLVLDNLADPAILNRPLSRGLVPAALPCRLLFTTRTRDLGRFTPVEITVLPRDAALRLLLRHPARQAALEPDHPEHEAAQAICAILGDLPLALEVAGAHLGLRPDAPLAAYREELERRGALPVLDDPRARLKDEDLPTRHQAAVAATLAGQWEGLEDDDARLVLRVAGQLPEAALIPVPRLGLLAGLDGQESGFFGSLLDAALDELVGASLVREFAERRTPDDETPAFRRECAAHLLAAYEDVSILEDHCARRGVDALEADLRAALALLPPSPRPKPPGGRGDLLQPRLRSLLRLIQREAHVLRGWDRETAPALFCQQILKRAVYQGLDALAAAARARLVDLARPRLDLCWRAGREAQALERTLSGHTGGVNGVAVTPEGRRVVSASSDHTLKVWDLQTGAKERTLAGHADWVRAVAVTPGGRRAVSASSDRTLKVWDLQTGAVERTLAGHAASVLAVAVTPDGRRAVSASDDRTLKVWDLQTGAKERTLTGHAASVIEVAVTPDGQRAVSASYDRTLKVCDLQTGQELATLSLEGAVECLAVAQDGATIVAGDAAGNVYCLRYVEPGLESLNH